MLATFNSRNRAVKLRARKLKLEISELCYDDSIEPIQLKTALRDFRNELETIEMSANHVHIAITGPVSCGKSSFINKLLGGNFVSASSGSTTAVPTYISFSDTRHYTATIHFLGTKDLKQKISDLVSKSLPKVNDRNDDHVYGVLSNTLSRFFKFNGSLNVPPHPSNGKLVSLPQEIGLLQFVGSEPLQHECNLLNEILLFVSKYMRFNFSLDGVDGILPFVVDRVCIEGRFPNLPPGVVLVDTPGLNDAERVNSQRTIDLLSTFNQIWYVCNVNDALASEAHAECINRAVMIHGCQIHVVGTFVDGKPTEQRSDVEELFKANLTKILVASVMKLKYHEVSRLHRGSIPNAVMETVDAKLVDITIGLTGIPPRDAGSRRHVVDPIGFPAWAETLRKIGVERGDNLMRLEESLQDLIRRVHSLGKKSVNKADVPVTAFERFQLDFHDEIKTLKAGLLSCFGDLSDDVVQKIFDGVVDMGRWNELHHKTIKATMNVRRQGVFRGSFAIRDGEIDVNEDIGSDWILTCAPILTALRALQERSITMLGKVVTGWKNAPQEAKEVFSLGARRVKDRFRCVEEGCFLGLGVSLRVQHFFAATGVFGVRTTFPTLAEFKSVLVEVLFRDAMEGLEHLHTDMSSLVRQLATLTSPVDKVPASVAMRIRKMLDSNVEVVYEGEGAQDLPELEAMKCPVTKEFFVDPVRTLCGHIVDNSVLINNIRLRSRGSVCPVCRASISSSSGTPVPQLLVAIAKYRERESARENAADVPMEVDEEEEVEEVETEWSVYWDECCEQWRKEQNNTV